jgi:hypothetical protein
MNFPCHRCGRIQHHPRAIAMSPLSMSTSVSSISGLIDGFSTESASSTCQRTRLPARGIAGRSLVEGIIPKCPTPILTAFFRGWSV